MTDGGEISQWDKARFDVLVEQPFAGGDYEWVSIREAATSFDAAADLFDWLIGIAERVGFRHVQIKRDQFEVVAQWPDGCPE